MTGMDVLRRVHAYSRDLEKLKLRRMCAHDAVTRCTRSTDVTGHGGAEDKAGRYAAQVDAIDRAVAARKIMYEMEFSEALEIVASLTEPSQGRAMYFGWLCGMTVRQTAAEMKISESGVRGLRRRGREVLEQVGTKLETTPAYQEAEKIYREENAH